MKKVGILTFHSAINNGAVLQAYALSKKVSSLGYDSEIIDYTSSFIKKFYNTRAFKGFKQTLYDILSYKVTKQTQRKFHDFKSNRLNLSKNYDDDFAAVNYDLLICGSDQVWNGKITHNDRNYAFHDLKCPIKTSYAASFGHQALTEAEIKMIIEDVSSFKYVSIREPDVQEELEKLLNINVTVVPDPVFLLTKSEWIKNLCLEVKNEKYILLFVLHRNEKIIEFAKNLSRLKRMPVYYLSNSPRNIKATKMIKGFGPIDFLNYILNASYVVSDSFHAISFSLIFNKQIYIGLKEGELVDLNSRVFNLSKLYELSNRMINEDTDIDTNLDYNVINTKIEKQRKYGIEELKKLLSLLG